MSGGIWHGVLLAAGYMSSGYLSGGICPELLHTLCITFYNGTVVAYVPI